MKRLATALIVQCVLILPATTLAQSRAIAAARLRASVEVDAQGLFIYRYVVENGGRSTAGVGKIFVDLDGPHASPARNAAEQPRLTAPRSWTSSLGTDTTARWVALEQLASISPNRQLAGFSMASHGPPSLTPFTLVPYLTPEQTPVTPPGEDPGEEDRYIHEFNLYVSSQATTGITLGPSTTLPTSAERALAALESELQQARRLRWITSDLTARELRTAIEAARAAAIRGNRDAAANSLRTLRKATAARAGTGLTSEAVGLVDATVQYALRLIARP